MIGTARVPMPNVFAGGLCTALLGRFDYRLFYALIPTAIIFSRLFPGESLAANFVKR